MLVAFRRLFRAIRLGLALERLERLEGEGQDFCIHNSWCGSDAFWIVIRRKRKGRRLKPPVAGPDLATVLERAAR